MAISQVPVDQNGFIKLMLVSVEPRTDRDTGQQLTAKNGMEKKWSVQVVAQVPSRWDVGRTESEVLSVTVTSTDDPGGKVGEGQQVWFDNLTAGVMDPVAGESGRIRGGKLFWSATGVQPRAAAGGKS